MTPFGVKDNLFGVKVILEGLYLYGCYRYVFSVINR